MLTYRDVLSRCFNTLSGTKIQHTLCYLSRRDDTQRSFKSSFLAAQQLSVCHPPLAANLGLNSYSWDIRFNEFCMSSVAVAPHCISPIGSDTSSSRRPGLSSYTYLHTLAGLKFPFGNVLSEHGWFWLASDGVT